MYVQASRSYAGFRYISSPVRGVRPTVSRHRVVMLPRRPRGMGDFNQTLGTASSIASAGAATTASLLVALGTVTGPVGALIGAAAAGLIQVGTLIAKAFEGCGQTCVMTSNDANQVEPYLVQNLEAYVSAPFDPALQAAAVNNFKTAWNALAQACGNPAFGSAGQRCISDRQSGACVWKASPGQWIADPTAPGGYRYQGFGPAGSGSACFNWFAAYLDPIQNDPRAANYQAFSPVTAAASSSASSVLSSFGINPTSTIAGVPVANLFWPAALLLGAAIFA